MPVTLNSVLDRLANVSESSPLNMVRTMEDTSVLATAFTSCEKNAFLSLIEKVKALFGFLTIGTAAHLNAAINKVASNVLAQRGVTKEELQALSNSLNARAKMLCQEGEQLPNIAMRHVAGKIAYNALGAGVVGSADGNKIDQHIKATWKSTHSYPYKAWAGRAVKVAAIGAAAAGVSGLAAVYVLPNIPYIGSDVPGKYVEDIASKVSAAVKPWVSPVANYVTDNAKAVGTWSWSWMSPVANPIGSFAYSAGSTTVDYLQTAWNSGKGWIGFGSAPAAPVAPAKA